MRSKFLYLLGKDYLTTNDWQELKELMKAIKDTHPK